jgi:hypothetical protein
MPHQLIALVALSMLLAACGGALPAQPPAAIPAAPAAGQADLSRMKEYLLGQTTELATASAALKLAADGYYELASAADFDYARLWAEQPEAAVAAVEAARAAWVAASPAYEKMEGIVAGTPSLAQFDVDLDAGAAAADDPEGAVSFDLSLPDGRVLPKPGNLFGITERALWGTDPAFAAAGVQPDWDGDGQVAFGETLPDANLLKGAADTLDRYANDLQAAGAAWTPTPSDAFTALVVMVPTMNEYFGSWRDSRFVAGETSTQGDFVAISRLADIQDILGGLEVVYAQVQPQVQTVDAAQGDQIASSLSELKSFIAGIYAEEQGGRRYSAEEADTLGAEAQNRATAITGQISQVAGELQISIQE